MKGTIIPVGVSILIGLLIFTMIHVEEEKTSQEKTNIDKEDILLWAKARNYFMALRVDDKKETDELENERFELGQLLYFDTRLSVNNEQSCNSCHDLSNYGVDNKPTSPGALPGSIGDRNSPTVLNAVFHDSQFWDGRAKDLAEQAKGPILNPVEMAIPHEGILIDRLKEVNEYIERFNKAFPLDNDPITYNNVATAIASFESMLITPSRFDDFMALDFEVLSIQEKRGLKVFLDANCQSCHDGIALGGEQYRRFGEMQDFRKLNPKISADEGIYNLTGNPGDLYKFKVPSLRNIEKTYPYFHDGSIWDLEESLVIMGKTQLNKEFTQNEIDDLVAFLRTLTGDLPKELKKVPSIPQ
ncbi:cytochrome-c peroxidase [Cecembia lonarensis]|uniref:Cytochrome c551 peroxidase n=1 Tax=Cecembia lonarensis (strain CCUG 58316 / KCTC 22772 / LW9) TaxID=1225176 RepID=K1M4B5_CECL9|nr:cytochrome c peroxidase [Cecembia lonarensis]EKB51094.1 Cytochrome c551 peroxidase precursor [Cecembia lonarensis LW9]